jgi:hypothetical protein
MDTLLQRERPEPDNLNNKTIPPRSVAIEQLINTEWIKALGRTLIVTYDDGDDNKRIKSLIFKILNYISSYYVSEYFNEKDDEKARQSAIYLIVKRNIDDNISISLFQMFIIFFFFFFIILQIFFFIGYYNKLMVILLLQMIYLKYFILWCVSVLEDRKQNMQLEMNSLKMQVT